MRYLRCIVAFLLGAICLAANADGSAAASGQAAKLVDCMKRFDANDCAPLIYAPYFEKQGADPTEFRKATAELNEKFKSIGARYSRFDLQPPGKLFTADSKLFVIVPYANTLEANGRRISKESFFVGVSENNGETWRFIEGFNLTQQTIRDIIPTYDGAQLPLRGMKVSQ